MGWWLTSSDDKKLFVVMDNEQLTNNRTSKKYGHVVHVEPCQNDSNKLKIYFSCGGGCKIVKNDFDFTKNEIGEKLKEAKALKSFLRKLQREIRLSLAGEDGSDLEEIQAPISGIPDTIGSKKIPGIHEVALTQLIEPPDSYKVRSIDGDFLSTLSRNLNINVLTSYRPVFPAMLSEEFEGTFNAGNVENYTFYSLGGNHFLNAVKNTHDARYQRVHVEIYVGLTSDEALAVASDHNFRTHLRKECTFQEEVTLCRNQLKKREMNTNLEPHELLKTTTEWKVACQQIIAGGTKSVKSLGTVFTTASTSERCWSLITSIFDAHQKRKLKDQTKSKRTRSKPLTQSGFQYIQGLKERHRFELLTKVVNKTISWNEMQKESLELKAKIKIKRKLIDALNCEDWGEARRKYPRHCTDSEVQRLSGQPFSRGSKSPKLFTRHVESAVTWSQGSRSDDPATISFVKVRIGCRCHFLLPSQTELMERVTSPGSMVFINHALKNVEFDAVAHMLSSRSFSSSTMVVRGRLAELASAQNQFEKHKIPTEIVYVVEQSTDVSSGGSSHFSNASPLCVGRAGGSECVSERNMCVCPPGSLCSMESVVGFLLPGTSCIVSYGIQEDVIEAAFRLKIDVVVIALSGEDTRERLCDRCADLTRKVKGTVSGLYDSTRSQDDETTGVRHIDLDSSQAAIENVESADSRQTDINTSGAESESENVESADPRPTDINTSGAESEIYNYLWSPVKTSQLDTPSQKGLTV